MEQNADKNDETRNSARAPHFAPLLPNTQFFELFFECGVFRYFRFFRFLVNITAFPGSSEQISRKPLKVRRGVRPEIGHHHARQYKNPDFVPGIAQLAGIWTRTRGKWANR